MNLVPANIKVSRKQGLTLTWADGKRDVFPISLLRSMCPCAKCKEEREEKTAKKPLLKILPGNYIGEMSILSVDMVGNYAIKIQWSDRHDTGIYTYDYLREIAGQTH